MNSKNSHPREFILVHKLSNTRNASIITIKKIITPLPKFGSAVLLQLIVYRGSTKRKNIRLFVTTLAGVKLSKETKVMLKENNTLYRFIIPVQLYSNTSNKYGSGKYLLVANGLGVKTTKELLVAA